MNRSAHSSNPRRSTTAASATVGSVRLGILVGIALLALLAGVWFLKRSPGGSGGPTGSRAEKAISGSVIRYEDRSYEGKAWKKKYAAANMGNLSVLGIRAAQLDQILGANENRIWVLDRKGVVFRRTDGHWELAANQPDLRRPVIGLIDDETVLLGSRLLSPLFLVKPAGVRAVDSDQKLSLRAENVVTPVAPGLCYIHTGRQTYKLVEEKLTLVSPGEQKDSVIVDEFGAPVTLMGRWVMTPNDFAFSANFSPGEVYAVWMDRRWGGRLVKYRDGAWVMIEVSTVAGSSERAMTILPVILIMQAIFSGGITRPEGAVKWISQATVPAYWGLDGLRSTFGAGLTYATYPNAPGHFQPPILGTGGPLWFDVAALVVLGGVISYLTLLALNRKFIGRVRW
jgi:hypothetical protein